MYVFVCDSNIIICCDVMYLCMVRVANTMLTAWAVIKAQVADWFKILSSLSLGVVLYGSLP